MLAVKGTAVMSQSQISPPREENEGRRNEDALKDVPEDADGQA